MIAIVTTAIMFLIAVSTINTNTVDIIVMFVVLPLAGTYIL